MTTTTFLTFVAVWVLVMIRNEVAFNIASKLLDQIYRHNVRKISQDKFDELIDYDALPSFWELVFDLTTWRVTDQLLRKVGIEEVCK